MQKSVKKAKVTGSMLAIFGVASVLLVHMQEEDLLQGIKKLSTMCSMDGQHHLWQF